MQYSYYEALVQDIKNSQINILKFVNELEKTEVNQLQ